MFLLLDVRYVIRGVSLLCSLFGYVFFVMLVVIIGVDILGCEFKWKIFWYVLYCFLSSGLVLCCRRSWIVFVGMDDCIVSFKGSLCCVLYGYWL